MCEALFAIGGKSRASGPVIHSEYCNSIQWNMLFPELEHINTKQTSWGAGFQSSKSEQMHLFGGNKQGEGGNF